MYCHLECKILVKIPDPLLNSALALREYKFINVSDLVKIKPKRANSKSFYHGKLKTRQSIYNLC